MKAPTTTTAIIQGLTIHEALMGDPLDGLTLVMLHGWGANIGLLWPLANQLVRLGYRVYLLDLPGFGKSDPPLVAWDVFDYVRFILACLEYHQLDRVFLFGHSFGGRLGLVLGADFPDRIDRMILANSAGIRPSAPLPAQLRLKTYQAVRDGLKNIGLGAVSERLRTLYNTRYGSPDFQATDGVMRETFVRVVNQDLRDHAARVRPPTLLLWGDHDTDTPLWQGQLLEQLIPDAGLVVFEGAGHYSYIDKLAETVRVIDYFLKHGQEG